MLDWLTRSVQLDWFHWNLSVGWFFVMIELIAYVVPFKLYFKQC
jgi:hypothetical protein